MITQTFINAITPHSDCLDWSQVSRFAGSGEQKRTPRIPRASGNVAVIPLQGIIVKRGNRFADGTDAVLATIRAALSSKAIGGIVLDVDSPGGSSAGLMEFADAIYNLRGNGKPIIAVANSLAASAAYWSATSADQFIASPSSEVGSVGVWTMHIDQSKYLADLGIDITLISAGQFKVEGHPFGPLTDEARAEYQRGVNETYDQFIAACARNRGVTKSKVLADFGQGRVLSAPRALAAGMVDRVATLDDVLESMGVVANGSTTDRNRAHELSEMLMEAWDGAQGGIDVESVEEVAESDEEPAMVSAESRRLAWERRHRNGSDN